MIVIKLTKKNTIHWFLACLFQVILHKGSIKIFVMVILHWKQGYLYDKGIVR